MNNLYLRKLTATQARGNQIDIPKTIAISFFEVSQDLIDQVENETINVCHRSNLTKFEQIEIQGATNPRFSTKLNTFLANNGDELEENDLLIVEKLGRSYSVGVIKKETTNYAALEELFDEGEKHMLLTANSDEHTTSFNKKTSSLPLQQIYYGAPGTGKSHETNKAARKYLDTIRTTFHPDSDYSTFVGAYKPTTTEEYIFGLNGGNTVQYKDPITNQPLKTSKIEYKFIPQAFIKAYIQAWKKMAGMKISAHASTTIGPIILTSAADSKRSWEITKIEGQDIYLESCYRQTKNELETSTMTIWENYWKSGIYTPDKKDTFHRHERSICNWIYQNGITDFKIGWDRFLEKLKDGAIEQRVDPNSSKPYFYREDGDDIVINANQHSTQDSISSYFESDEMSSSFQKAIANKLKEYSTDIDEAWQKLEDNLKQVGGGGNTIEVDPQFLVIEEINRGNCAQIFGDIFQLLDRNKAGFSEYPIDADEDISKYIKEELKGRVFDSKTIDYINNLFVDGDMNPLTYDLDGKRVHILEAILNGKVLVLPSNLHIWATMNTSDQSLFPIDSAFKRRWDWVYMPIKEAKDKNWKIQVGDSQYDWWEFVQAINIVINVVTNSEDKKIGYFFCKPCDDKNITASQFVNKIIFYLWNDVFKDYDLPVAFIYGEVKNKPEDGDSEHMSFNDFYTDQEVCIHQLMKNLKVQPESKTAKTEVTPEKANETAVAEATTEPQTD